MRYCRSDAVIELRSAEVVMVVNFREFSALEKEVEVGSGARKDECGERTAHFRTAFVSTISHIGQISHSSGQ